MGSKKKGKKKRKETVRSPKNQTAEALLLIAHVYVSVSATGPSICVEPIIVWP